ncbi:hypothetical protein ABZP36_019572 [Zizania latifolia]
MRQWFCCNCRFDEEDDHGKEHSNAQSNKTDGSYGRVYHATLDDGRQAAVKKLDASDNEPNDEFLKQVSQVSRLKHENLVEMLGYYVEGNYRILAYEFATMGSLHDVLHGRKGVQGAQPGPVLDWMQRHLKTQFRNMKNKNLANKKCNENVNINISRTKQLTACSANQHWNHVSIFLLTDKWFIKLGLLVTLGFEILKQEIDQSVSEGQATPRLSEDKVKQCVDPRLKGEYPPKGVAKLAAVAALCVQYEAEFRPNMSIVVKALSPLLQQKPVVPEPAPATEN